MYVIITYDISDEKRINKARKILKKYLNWVQLSTFEGEITKGKLAKCLSELNNILKTSEDSVYVYEVENPANINKKILGIDKAFIDNFL